MRKLSFLSVMLAAAAAAPSGVMASADVLLDARHPADKSEQVPIEVLDGLKVADAAIFDIDLTGVSDESERLTLKSPSGEVLEFVRTASEQGDSGMLVWHGALIDGGASAGWARLTVADGRAAGAIVARDREWRLMPSGELSHVLLELNATELQSPGVEDVYERFPADGLQDGQVRNSAKSQVGGGVSAESGLTTHKSTVSVDVLVAVDSRYESRYANARVLASDNLNHVNQILAASAISVRLNLAGTVVVQDTPGLEPVYQLQALVSPNDGVMDTVHPLRDGLGADIVILLSKRSGSVCGIAQSLNPTAASAFAVVGGLTQCDSTLFAHEVAHLFGADHDPANACSNPQVQCTPDSEAFAKPYAHGFVRNYFASQMAFESYATVMTYNTSSTCAIGMCQRMHAFSNPRVLDDYGYPMGRYDSHDNARVITEQAPRIAAFRSAPVVGQVQPTSGAWYNPGRSGNGLSLSRSSSGALGAVWFTYSADGRPTWYTTQMSQVVGGVWNSVLMRSQRGANGAVVTSVVGDARLRFWNQNEAVFSWDFHNNGNSADFDGAEYVRLLFGGGAASGMYYNPLESGWGFNFDHAGSSSVATFYYFDSNGNPVWAMSAPHSGSLTALNQYSLQRHTSTGLCPTCQAESISRAMSAAGNATLRMSPSASGWVSIQSPDGSWIRGSAASPLQFGRLTQP